LLDVAQCCCLFVLYMAVTTCYHVVLQGLSKALADLIAQSASSALQVLHSASSMETPHNLRSPKEDVPDSSSVLEASLPVPSSSFSYSTSSQSRGGHPGPVYSDAGLPTFIPEVLQSSLLSMLQHRPDGKQWTVFEQHALAPCNAWLITAAQQHMESVLPCSSPELPQSSRQLTQDSARSDAAARTSHAPTDKSVDVSAAGGSSPAASGELREIPGMEPYVTMTCEITAAWLCSAAHTHVIVKQSEQHCLHHKAHCN